MSYKKLFKVHYTSWDGLPVTLQMMGYNKDDVIMQLKSYHQVKELHSIEEGGIE
ncbi:hypothetical protein [Bacillus mycoides]|nr:hypothetical protein [Bacillus mycoides]HDR7566338.1 hypothetical protein [Bacillus mycoides]